jgi:hypothetical protein
VESKRESFFASKMARTPAQDRELHARRKLHARHRLARLRTVCPDLPDDVLERVSLRQLSFSVRRVAKLPKRGKSAASAANEKAEVRSNAGEPGRGPYQKLYQASLAQFAAPA